VNDGWQILKIGGIPLKVHPSWFVILLLATSAFAQHYGLNTKIAVPVVWQWGLGFLTALLLFISVLLHELGHSFVAMAQGVKVRSITLFLLGGVASVERECSTAMGALMVAAAGPAVSLVLGFALLANVHTAAHTAPVLGDMVAQLGSLNLVLGLFNLLPGLPLDGGLIVKAVVWQVSGSQRRGIEVANACGRVLALLAMGLGTLLLVRGAGLSGAWLILLGWFGLGAARNQYQLLSLQTILKELRVREAAGRRFRVLDAKDSLRQLSQLRIGEAKELSQGDRAVGRGSLTMNPCNNCPSSVGTPIASATISSPCPAWLRFLRTRPFGRPCSNSKRPKRNGSWCSVPPVCPAAPWSGPSSEPWFWPSWA